MGCAYVLQRSQCFIVIEIRRIRMWLVCDGDPVKTRRQRNIVLFNALAVLQFTFVTMISPRVQQDSREILRENRLS